MATTSMSIVSPETQMRVAPQRTRVLECMKQIRDETGVNIVILRQVKDKSPGLFLEIVDSHFGSIVRLVNDGKISPFISNGRRVNGSYIVNEV